MSQPGTTMSLTRRALAALQKAENEIRELRDAKPEPIAVVGAGCRLPGGTSSRRAFSELLEKGFDALAGVPSDRHELFDLRGVRGPSSGTLEKCAEVAR